MRRRPFSVVKVGGSLLADAPRLRTVLAAIADGADGPALVVPGGGRFADAVRATQAALAFDDRLAHRLALAAMCQMAEVLSAIEPRLRIVRDDDAITADPPYRPAIWAPAGLLGGHRDIPETWDVTSDSLALWLAARLGAKRCILIKSVPCPSGAGSDSLARSGIVDAAFPIFARAFFGEIIIRGPDGDAIVTPDPAMRSSNPPRHPAVTARSGTLEGDLRKPQRSLEVSLEGADAALQDEGEGWRSDAARAESAA